MVGGISLCELSSRIDIVGSSSAGVQPSQTESSYPGGNVEDDIPPTPVAAFQTIAGGLHGVSHEQARGSGRRNGEAALV